MRDPAYYLYNCITDPKGCVVQGADVYFKTRKKLYMPQKNLLHLYIHVMLSLYMWLIGYISYLFIYPRLI